MLSSENLSNLIQSRRVVDEIINAISTGKDAAFIRCALRVLRATGPGMEEFTACNVWDALEAAGIAPPEEPRSMAAVMTKAKGSGWIESTSKFRTSHRAKNHGRPVRVWRWVQ